MLQWETDQKYEEMDLNLRKLFNKLRFFKFLIKAEMNQKYKETDLIFEETDQQNEIFKVFKVETDQ